MLLHKETVVVERRKFIRLKVYKDRIEQTISNEKIEFDDDAIRRDAYAHARMLLRL